MVCACAHREAPALSTRRLAGGAVTYRPWGPRICEAEPRFLLDELSAVNAGLQRWLDRSAGDAAAAWPESRIAETTRWSEPLAELARDHTLNLEALKGCDFAASAGYPFVLERGRSLLASVRERERQLEQVHARARATRALDAWVRGLDAERTAARRTCPARSAAPVVFFAWRDEDGVTHWLFCDGATAESAPDGKPEVLEPAGRRRFGAGDYRKALEEFPAMRISVAPKA